MKPETEYTARQLAHIILHDDGQRSRMGDAGVGVVEVHMQGMVRSIRQQILVDHVDLAAHIADEIERQTKGVNLDAIVADEVRKEVGRVKASIPRLVEDAVKRTVADEIERKVSHACKVAAAASVDRLTSGVAERLYAVAYPPRKEPA